MFNYSINTIYKFGNTSVYSLDLFLFSRIYNCLLSGDAIKLYLHLYYEFSSQDISFLLEKNLENLFSFLSFDEEQFLDAKKNLEALNLIKTYRNKENEIIFYLNNPLTLKEFINDVGRKEILVAKIGQKLFDSLTVEFSVNNNLDNYFLNESASFDEYFNNKITCNSSLNNQFGNEIKRIDIFANNLSEKELIEYLNKYSYSSPEKYLSFLINSSISDDDKNVLNKVKKTFGLSDELLNIMMDFSIARTHNKINEKYLSKMAKTFSLKKINDCYKAYLFLKNWDDKNTNDVLKNNKKQQQLFENNISTEKKINNFKIENVKMFEEEEIVDLSWC